MEKVSSPEINRLDDITIRDIFIKSWEYALLIIKYWWVVIILSAAFAIKDYRFIAAIKPVYPAEITMLVKTQDIAKENKANILIYSRFANAQSTIAQILLEPIDSTNDELIINHYLKTYFDLKPEGLSLEIPPDFQFSHNNPQDFSTLEHNIFKSIVTKMTTYVEGYADGFVNVSVDESLGMVTIATSTPSESLTLLLMTKLEEYFKQKTFSNSIYAETKSHEVFTAIADSLERNYRSTYYNLHKLRDLYQSKLKRAKDSTSRELRYLHKKIIKLEVQADIYEKNWLSTVKTLRSIEQEKNRKVPIIEILKKTLPPLYPYMPNPKSAAIKGFIKGLTISIGLIIFYSILLSIIKNPEEKPKETDENNEMETETENKVEDITTKTVASP